MNDLLWHNFTPRLVHLKLTELLNETPQLVKKNSNNLRQMKYQKNKMFKVTFHGTTVDGKKSVKLTYILNIIMVIDENLTR